MLQGGKPFEDRVFDWISGSMEVPWISRALSKLSLEKQEQEAQLGGALPEVSQFVSRRDVGGTGDDANENEGESKAVS